MYHDLPALTSLTELNELYTSGKKNSPVAKYFITFALQMRHFLLVDGRKAATPQQSVHGFYDKRAFAILREAMNMGCLPALKLGSGGSINLRGTPPVVAEVFFLEVLAGVVEGERR